MKMIVAGTLAMSLGLSACAHSGSPDRAGSTCSTDAAAGLVGEVAPDDAGILRRTGGTIVRRIAPGDPTTKDYRVERVTVTVADDRVVSASCG